MRKALEKLPLNFREVLILREFEGMSYREIAYIAGMPAGTVMSILSRARDRLRQDLKTLMKGDAGPNSPQMTAIKSRQSGKTSRVIVLGPMCSPPPGKTTWLR